MLKYARVIKSFAELTGRGYDEAMDIFYRSKTFECIERGIADMHCRSDRYLVDELVLELQATSE